MQRQGPPLDKEDLTKPLAKERCKQSMIWVSGDLPLTGVINLYGK